MRWAGMIALERVTVREECTTGGRSLFRGGNPPFKCRVRAASQHTTPPSVPAFPMSRTWTALLIVIALFLLVIAGPKAETDLEWTDVAVPEDVDRWLEENEASLGNVQPAKEKAVIWAKTEGERTPFSVVYLHGFSASRLEAAPYPDSLAAALGANLHYSRLAGHGRDSAAMGASTAAEWYQSAVEAIRVGEAIGDSLIIVGLSTGGTLAAAAALDPDLNRRWKAQVWISPNFAVADSRSDMLLWPWGHVLLRLVQGDTYSWEPQNEKHAAIGNTEYDSRVLIEVVSLADAVQEMPFEDIETPTLLIYSKDDLVVDPEVTEELYARMTSRRDSIVVRRALDHNMHVIVGDALGPENTIPLARRTEEWLKSLGLTTR